MREHARRWRLGNPAGSGGGRLGVRGRFCSCDFVRPVRILPFRVAGGWKIIYTDFSGSRALEFIYTQTAGVVLNYFF